MYGVYGPGYGVPPHHPPMGFYGGPGFGPGYGPGYRPGFCRY